MVILPTIGVSRQYSYAQQLYLSLIQLKAMRLNRASPMPCNRRENSHVVHKFSNLTSH